MRDEVNVNVSKTCSSRNFRNPSVMSLKLARRPSCRLKNATTSGTSGGTPRRQRESSHTGLSEQVADHYDLDSIVEVVDEYEYLRYKDDVGRQSVVRRDFPTRTVYVRRLRTEELTVKPQPPKRGLLLPEGTGEEPLQVYNQKTSLVQQMTEALHKQLMQDRSVRERRQRNLTGQEASLVTWDNVLCDWDNLGNHLTKTMDRPRHSQLINQRLALPPIQNHLAPSHGSENDFPQWRQKERFFRNDAFFLLPEHIGPEDDSLTFSLPWSQRQFYKPPVAMVRPDLGEQPVFRDPSGVPQQLSKTEQELMQLTVTGKGLFPDNKQGEPPAKICWPDRKEDDPPLPSITLSSEKQDSKRSVRDACSTRLASPVYVRINVPAFMLEGFTYVWGQPCLHDIVEIGVSSNAGKRGVTYIRVANVGCCVMRYSWRLLPHKDHFIKGRYRRSPFIFNSANGSLLPEEKISIPVQFYSSYAGCWTERWMLRTTPCVYTPLKNKEQEIAVSLWGQALEVDVNLTTRKELDAELTNSAMLRMVERYVWDLVRLLPIRSPQRIWAEEHQAELAAQLAPFPPGASPEEDPVTAFSRLNPRLHYHSSAMSRVLMARYDLQHELHVLAEQQQSNESRPGTESGTLASQSRLSVSISSGGDKDKLYTRQDSKQEKTPRSRKITQTRQSAGDVSHKQKTRRTTRLPQYIPGKTGSTTMCNLQEVELKELRQQVNLDQVHRKAYDVLDEDRDKKEAILGQLNRAVMAMSSKPSTPPMRHFKYLVVRAALVQLFDELSGLEWKLRQSLGLLDDIRFDRLATFPQEGPRVIDSKKNRPMSKDRNKKYTPSVQSRKSSVKGKMAQPEEPEVEPVSWDDVVPAQYREKLAYLVYHLLATRLTSLLPVATFDGYRLDPFLPPLEI